MGKTESVPKTFSNRQIVSESNSIVRICKLIQSNGHDVRLTVSPVSDSVNEATGLAFVLDVDDWSFFYGAEVDALHDQTELCEVMRKAGLVVAKVIKNEPISILSK